MEPLLLERFDHALTHGPRTFKITTLSDLVVFGDALPNLIAINQSQAAIARRTWLNGGQQVAITRLKQLTNSWSSYAPDSLIAAMVATRAQKDILLSIHSLTQVKDHGATNEEWSGLIEATLSVDSMVHQLGKAIENEWLLGSAMYQDIQRDMSHQPWHPKHLLYRAAYDPEDSMNRHATMLLHASADAQRGAQGMEPLKRPAERCSGFPLAGSPSSVVCRLLGRNSLGIMLIEIGLPDYHAYGTRVADLRNLAAATRLTIEARRRGLSGEALARFVAQSPEDMRDVFTRQPFAYNLQTRELTIVLREKSSVLGDAGEYRLPL